MLNKLKNFRRSEDGAITVDWVVLTAAVVALAGGIIIAINSANGDVSSGTSNFMTDFVVGG